MRLILYRDDVGEWRWRLRARNGRIIADSGEGYERRSDAIAGMKLVGKALRKPKIEDAP